MKTFLAIAAAGLLLTACASAVTTHDAVKLQGIGINMSPSTGVTGGQISATVDRSPEYSPDGKTQNLVAGPCGRTDSPSTYSNLNSKATATATSVPTIAKDSVGISSPSIAIASGDTAANGGAALVAAAATTSAPADVLAAYSQSCPGQSLPSAPPSSIVRDGVSPK